ncbi:MAG: hypothetical protein U0270_42255 [Labilithrix sp.]
MNDAESTHAWATLLRDDARGARVTYVHRAEMVIAVESDGKVLVRDRGGPVFHMGRLWSYRTRVVRAWRVRIPSTRHAAMIASLIEAEFPIGRVDAMPVPDELFSSITVSHRTGDEASMGALHRAVVGDIALHRLVTELDGIGQAVKGGPPTERLENPELHEWDRLDASAGRAPDDLVPRPTADAMTRAQASVDAFYAQQLDERLRYVEGMHPRRTSAVTTEPRPIVHSPPQPLVVGEPVVAGRPVAAREPHERPEVTCTFSCARTSAAAGVLTLSPDGTLALTGFSPTGNVTRRIEDEEWSLIAGALADEDTSEICDFDPEMIPFYCSSCDSCYAASEWKIYERSASSLDGVCPQGHRRGLRTD